MPRGDGTGPMGMGPTIGRAKATAAAEASQDLLAAPDSVLAEVAEAEEVGMADGTCCTLLA